MTIRITIEIVPYGIEGNKFVIYEIEASNQRTIEEKGFGNTICLYEYRLHDEEALIAQGEVTHNRKEGALTLVSKILLAEGIDPKAGEY